MTFAILPMTFSHLDEMAALEQVCFSMPWSRASLQDELSNEYAVYYVAEDEAGKVAGYAGIHIVLDEAYITNVAVRPDARRNGVATALMRRLENVARGSGAVRMLLEVRESNSAARAAYEKLDLRPIAVRPRYYIRPTEDAVIYEKILKEDE